MPFEVIDSYVAQVGGRRLAEGEWKLEANGVEVGLRVANGLLRVEAWAAPAGACDPAQLLHRNRSLELVRYAATKSGEVWVVGDVPADPEGPQAEHAPVARLRPTAFGGVCPGALVDAALALRASTRFERGGYAACLRARSRYSR